jgi:hypothetical protein
MEEKGNLRLCWFVAYYHVAGGSLCTLHRQNKSNKIILNYSTDKEKGPNLLDPLDKPSFLNVRKL